MRVLLLLWLLSIAMGCSAEDKPIPSAKELFEWYDRLGFEDVSKAKFARIWTGDSVLVGGVGPDQDVSDGFVLHAEDGTFLAVLADLTLGNFKKSGADPSKADFCGYRELSLKDEAERLIQDLKNPRYFEEQEEDESHYRYYDRLSRHAQVFVIARECARRELSELGDQLVRALAEHPEEDGSNRRHPFPHWLKEDLTDALRWRAKVALRDPAQSWVDIREIHRRIVDYCPDTYPVEGAREMIHRITILLEKEKTRKPLAPDDPEELVWRLHEEQDDEIPDKEWARSYPFEPRKSTGAMKALVKLGKEAVPALIAELQEAPRLSRSARRSTRFGGNMWTQDTHDLTLRVLEKIAGFNFRFYVEGDAWAQMLGAIDDWWRAVRRGEERQWLVEKVCEGGRRADAVADSLLTRYPDYFFDAAIFAIRNSDDPNDPHPRREMIQRLSKLKDSRVPGYFLAAMAAAANLGEQTELAAALRKLNRPEGEERIVNEIRKANRADFEKHPLALAPFEWQQGLAKAFYFALETESPMPLQVIAEKWSILPKPYRAATVENLRYRTLHGDASETCSPLSPATQVAIRDLLLLALEDTTPNRGIISAFDGETGFERRLSDEAAMGLHKHWPEEFHFEITAPESARERQRITILSAHYRSLDQPELPLPKPHPKVAPEQGNDLATIDWSDSIPADEPLRGKLASWIGKPVSAEQISAALLEHSQVRDRRRCLLQVDLFRDGDETGVHLRLQREPTTQTGDRVSMNIFISLAGKLFFHGNADPADPKEWERLRLKLDKALASPRENPFVITLQIEGN